MPDIYDSESEVRSALDRAGITIPFPQRTLWFGPGNTELSLESADSSGPEA